MESIKVKLIELENNSVVTGAREWGKWVDVGQMVQTFHYKMSQF